jgi:hypothetical protein
MKTAWSHLPNAQHIDRILADVKVNPNHWNAVRDAASHAALDAAENTARHTARLAPWGQASNAARHAARHAAYNATCNTINNAAFEAINNAAYNSITALVAWDEASDYLNSSVDQVKIWTLLGDKKAVLMLPAVLAFEKSKELA